VRGCPRRDKGSTDVTFIEKARKSGRVEIRTGCQVTRLHASGAGRIGHVEYVDQDQVRHKVSGTVIALAGGAVETPRLLLASADEHAPEGIANESGQVGRNFMETLTWASSGLVNDDLKSYAGLPSDAICWDFNRPDSIADVTGGCRFTSSIHEAELDGPVAYATRVVPGWGKDHKQSMRQQFGRVITVGSVGEFLPNARTYVDLDPQQKDTAGMPLGRMHSYLPERELQRLQFMATTCRKILAAAGVKELFEEYGSHDLFNATHVFGTCRMGSDPADSVVDSNCRSHHWKNLYTTDASVFPSSGGGESPSLTIQALAMRAADSILRNLAALS
jgi:choline dehydrogenase-like flavoprotein